MNQLELLAKMRDALIESAQSTREVERFGGFVFLRHASVKLVWNNQTIPQGACKPEDLTRLLARYEEMDRDPFFEFSPELAPEVPAMLEDAGMVLKAKMPVMALPRDQWIKRPYADKARLAKPEDILPAIAAVSEAFGSNEIDDGAEERVLDSMESGVTSVAVAYEGDHIVAMGSAVGTPKIREVAGIGTHSAHRRQGYAGAVINCLLDQFFSAEGEIAWLTPGNDGAESLYRSLGFEPVGSQVCYSIADE